MSETAFVSTRPQFKVDSQARDDMQASLTAMVINLPLHGSAHAELHLTNWGRLENNAEPDFIFNDILLGAGIEIETSEEDAVTSLFNGEITAIEERYGEGAPTVVLLLQDKLHHLARSRNNRSFEDQSPDQIVQTIAADAGLNADVNLSGITAIWNQLNESDLAFLMRLSSSFDIALRLNGRNLRVRAEEPDPNPIALDAQDSALRVRLMADLNHQPLNTRVQGYNAASAEDVQDNSDSLTPQPAASSAADTLRDLGWSGEEIVPQPFPRSAAEAQAYAEAHFQRQAKRFVRGDIVCQGEAELNSGRSIELSGVSPRLHGIYRIVNCVHCFDNVSGFETHLKVNKADWR